MSRVPIIIGICTMITVGAEKKTTEYPLHESRHNLNITF